MTPLEWIAAAAAVLAAAVWTDIRRHPWRRCRPCNGVGVTLDEGLWGACRRCGGTGSVRRSGAGKEK